jgi:hypothetical protein
MADIYDTLNATDQATVRSKLLAVVQSKPCPNVDVTGITTVDSLTDAGNRGIAIDCFQQAHKVGAVAGALDQATYSALVGWWPARPLWQKAAIVGGGVAAVAVGYHFATKRSRRRRLSR